MQSRVGPANIGLSAAGVSSEHQRREYTFFKRGIYKHLSQFCRKEGKCNFFCLFVLVMELFC